MLVPDRLRQAIHPTFSAIVLLHTLAFLLFWLTNRLFYQDVNTYLANKIGSRTDYISWFLAFTLLVALACLAWLRWQVRALVIAGWVLGVIFLLFFYGSFTLLFREAPTQIPRLRQMAGYFRLILDTLLLVILAILLRNGLRYLVDRGHLAALMATAACIVVLALAWTAAFIFPPGNVYRSPLPPKPLLIAHRGASMLAPENTLASAEVAAQLGVYGIETDVRLSLDGVPFLMHDSTLQRTTDVAKVFPGQEKENAANFTFEQVSQLSAGRWFVTEDPSGTLSAGLVKPEELERYRTEPVPTLAEELDVVRGSGLIFIFDLLPPPEGHPGTPTFFQDCFKVIQAAGIDAQVWFLADESERLWLQAHAPEMKLAAGISAEAPPPAQELVSQGYRIVNSEYTLDVQALSAYQKAGLWVNLYTVDEPWQYSRLWLKGVSSVTSNNVHTLIKMQSPTLALPGWAYALVWGGIGVLVMTTTLLLMKNF